MLVTGASGGIGSACARAFAAEGSRVLVHYHRGEETLRMNLTATFLVARGFLREVERNGHGSFVLVGSTAGIFGEAVVDPDQVRVISRTMAMRKVAQPGDVAAQVVVLASDTLSGHVSGQVVVVAGSKEGQTVHEE